MYIADHGQLYTSIPGNESGQREIKSDEEQDEKANEESDFFLVHNTMPATFGSGLLQSYGVTGGKTICNVVAFVVYLLPPAGGPVVGEKTIYVQQGQLGCSGYHGLCVVCYSLRDTAFVIGESANIGGQHHT